MTTMTEDKPRTNRGKPETNFDIRLTIQERLNKIPEMDISDDE
jgi:hypothetical protein